MFEIRSQELIYHMQFRHEMYGLQHICIRCLTTIKDDIILQHKKFWVQKWWIEIRKEQFYNKNGAD